MSNSIRSQSSRVLRVVFTLLVVLLIVLSSSHYNTALATPKHEPPTEKLAYKVISTNGEKSLNIYDPGSRTTTLVYSGPTLSNFSFSQSGLLAFILSDENQHSLWIYNPYQGLSMPVITNATDFPDYRLSVDGRLAYSKLSAGVMKLYVWDTRMPKSAPINISQEAGRALDWSPDGRYLAFEAYDDHQYLRIYLWDGKTITDITPSGNHPANARSFPVWSKDNKLAFEQANQIFVWDGKSTFLFQRSEPNTDDKETTYSWGTDGRLSLASVQHDKLEMAVWDGVTFTDGTPDLVRYTLSDPGLYPSLYWTNTGLLAFTASFLGDSHLQIYVWDGRSITNISQNPKFHNIGAQWNPDGRWAFSTFDGGQYAVGTTYVRDAENRTLLTSTLGVRPALASNGYAAFCNNYPSLSKLFVWDGREVIKIAEDFEVYGEWQNGNYTVCNSSRG
jgi:hypothetical protein